MNIVAVTATFRRPRELARLLGSLAGVERIVVCDNSASAEVRVVVDAAPLPAHYLAPAENLGCGGGLRLAEEHAWEITGGSFTHLLLLDDDAVLEADTAARLVDALARDHADAACPLLLGPDGRTGWTPGLRDRAKHRLGLTPMTPDDFLARFGSEAAEFTWAQGICLLARREAVERAGFHRAEFWVRGEDLDFSLRLTARGRGVFIPTARAHHLPPPAGADDRAEFLRHAAMVQNIAFLALHQPHGARIRGSLAGTSRRFIAQWGVRGVPDLVRALWRGGVRAEPAGCGEGRTFRRRHDELARA